MSSRNVKRQRLNDSNDAGNSHCVCQPILSEQIMAFIKNENKTLLDKFERLLDEKFSYRPLWIKNTSTSLLPSFPINSVDKFDKFNKKLKTNKDVRKQFTQFLLERRGINLKHFVPKILNTIITDHVAMAYSWSGKTGKKSFEQTEVCRVIKGATFDLFEATYCYTDMYITQRLQYVKTRCEDV